jgi:hypothetical protein
MGEVTIGTRDATQVGGLLRQVGGSSSTRDDIRANAAYWASEMHGTMDHRDLQTVTWLLSEISEQRQVPAAQRRTAGYWANSLATRL